MSRLLVLVGCFLVLVAMGCEQESNDVTQLVVTLHADASVASSLTRIDVQTYPDASAASTTADGTHSFVLDQASAQSLPVALPFSFGIRKRDRQQFLLVVKGFTGDTLTIEQKVLLAFTPGQTRGVRVYLAQACFQHLCAQETAADWLQRTCYPDRPVVCGEVLPRQTEPVAPGTELQIIPVGVGSPASIADAQVAPSDGGIGNEEVEGGLGPSGGDSAVAPFPIEPPAFDAGLDASPEAGAGDAALLDAHVADVVLDSGPRDAGVDGSATACATLACPANSTCSAAGGARCICNSGFQMNASSACENIDDCRGSPCGAGNSCLDAVNDFSCVCAASRFQVDSKRCAPKFAGVAVGQAHGCGLRTDGTVSCWGIGKGSDFDRAGMAVTVPTTLSWIANVTAIAASEYHTCALRDDGTVWCWGESAAGQLGHGMDGVSGHHPAQGIADAIAIAVGGAHTCAIRLGGRVSCWGDGQFVGGGFSGVFANTPVAVPDIDDATSITASKSHTCVLRRNGSASCWGPHGYCGTVSATPVTVSAWSGAQELAAGHGFTCARRSDGTVACCGSNYYGQLGDGTSMTTATTPVVVRSLANVARIGAGMSYACAARVDGSAACWGQGSGGQLGSGLRENSSLPVPVFGDLRSVVSIAGSDSFTCATLRDGNLSCWGLGYPGDGSGNGVNPGPITVRAY